MSYCDLFLSSSPVPNISGSLKKSCKPPHPLSSHPASAASMKRDQVHTDTSHINCASSFSLQDPGKWDADKRSDVFRLKGFSGSILHNEESMGFMRFRGHQVL